MAKIDPKVRKIAEDYVATGSNKRAVAAVRMMLQKGAVTTDDLNALGYNHPPRAIGDVRDAGIPVITESTTSAKTGRRMAMYRLGAATDIVRGRIGGRSALPKTFKAALIARYGSRDCITGALLPETVLQIDHRVPFRVAGDAGLTARDVEAYMLLDASSQRTKSWSCEGCMNFIAHHNPTVCQACYWASPERYDHIGLKQIRRTDVTWQDDEVALHDRVRDRAALQGLTVAEFLKNLARQL